MHWINSFFCICLRHFLLSCNRCLHHTEASATPTSVDLNSLKNVKKSSQKKLPSEDNCKTSGRNSHKLWKIEELKLTVICPLICLLSSHLSCQRTASQKLCGSNSGHAWRRLEKLDIVGTQGSYDGALECMQSLQLGMKCWENQVFCNCPAVGHWGIILILWSPLLDLVLT